jgi:hypothetical protein
MYKGLGKRIQWSKDRCELEGEEESPKNKRQIPPIKRKGAKKFIFGSKFHGIVDRINGSEAIIAVAGFIGKLPKKESKGLSVGQKIDVWVVSNTVDEKGKRKITFTKKEPPWLKVGPQSKRNHWKPQNSIDVPKEIIRYKRLLIKMGVKYHPDATLEHLKRLYQSASSKSIHPKKR